jgi:hypothetical protein
MRRLACTVGLIVFMTSAASAPAAPVTVGNPLLGTIESTGGSGISATLINLTVAAPGANATSPVNGAIVRWHLLKAAGGPFRLRVLRPAGGTSYTAVGTSGPAEAVTPGLETYETAMPIQAGDTIGLDVVKGLKVGALGNPASVIAAISPIMVEGATAPITASSAGAEFAFNAEVQPTPTLTALAPASGSFRGGKKAIKITGTDFTGASAVSFGGVPAKSFTLVSETVIKAIPPAVKKPSKVDVTVTTVAGTTAVGAASFSYLACVVPKLKGRSLKAAKKRLRKANCKVGKVTKRGDATAKTGAIVKQGKPSGKKLVPGTKVSITLG